MGGTDGRKMLLFPPPKDKAQDLTVTSIKESAQHKATLKILFHLAAIPNPEHSHKTTSLSLARFGGSVLLEHMAAQTWGWQGAQRAWHTR